MLHQPFSRFLLRTTSNFPNHNNPLRLWIIGKTLKTINKIGSIKRISSNPNTRTLPQPCHRRLMHRLIRKCPTPTHHPNLPLRVNIPRHNTNLTLPRLDNTRTIRSYQPCRSLRAEGMLHLRHILLGHTFGNGNDEGYFVFNGVHDGGGAEWRWDVYDGCIGLYSLDCFGDGVEYGEVEVGLPSFFGGYASDHFGSVFYCLSAVECSLFSSETLAYHTRILVYPNLSGG
mmetsp:Transcript_16981/g.20193  ORF Transcript_16981/g.20193 Transcript_16981/m.20193 type:complete len:229 (+) Transcript_16981:381-1067(+)